MLSLKGKRDGEENFVEKKSTVYVSKKGLEEYQSVIDAYKVQLAQLRSTSASYGINTTDDYRRSEYDREENALVSTIARLQKELSEMVVVDEKLIDESLVNIDDIVVVKMESNGEASVEKFELTGGIPSVGRENEIQKISINAPLGKAIYKKKVGDTSSYVVGNRKFVITIMSKETPAQEKTQAKQFGE